MSDTTWEQDARPISSAFLCVCSLATALGAVPINRQSGAWMHRFTDASGYEWAVAVNGHREPCDDPLFGGEPIAPFDALVSFNGWPFATFGPSGGTFGAGEAANEDTFIAALIAETKRVAKAEQ